MSASEIRPILIIDDEEDMHSALEFILANRYHIHSAMSGSEALELNRRHEFPVVILDLELQDLSGLDLLRAFKSRNEQQKVIILTGRDTKKSAIEALNLGAFRFLVKPFNHQELLDSLEQAFDKYKLERAALSRPQQALEQLLMRTSLTPRQMEIVILAAQGDSNAEIADRLGISERTVEKHMENIYEAMGVSSRARLIARLAGMAGV